MTMGLTRTRFALLGWTLLLWTAAAGRPAAAAVKTEIVITRARVEGAAAATTVMKRQAYRHLAQAKNCYLEGLKRNKGLVARLYMDVTVKPDGTVSRVSMDRNSQAPEYLFQCVAAYVRRWRLSPWNIKHVVLAGLGYDFMLTAPVPKGTVVNGGLKAKYVAGVFTAWMGDLKKCIQKQVVKPLKLRASVGILFHGKVSSASVNGRWNRADKKCMSNKMLTWRFPFGHHGHRSYVVYPLVFRPMGASVAPRPARGRRKRSAR